MGLMLGRSRARPGLASLQAARRARRRYGHAMPIATSLRAVVATRYVTALREGGSLPGLVEADDDGLYVTKFRGAGQGLHALVAEVIVGELVRRAGPLVPELITASPGSNLGVDFLPGALPYTPAGAWTPDPELAAEVVWLDALTTNVDRSARNPNLLLWHDRLWLIDHGAALYLQHAGLDPAAQAQRPFPLITEHVLLPFAGSILEADERLRARVDEQSIEAVVGLVPVDWFVGDPPETYVEYLTRRLASQAFAQEAERARR